MKLLTAQEAADFLDLSIHTVRLYTSIGKLPHYKLGSKVRFKESDLVEWLESRRVAAK